MSVVHHVLGKFDQDDYATILLAIDKSEEALRFYLKEVSLKKQCNNTMDKYKTLVDLFQQNKDIRKWQQDQQKRSRSLLLGLSSSTKAITMATVVEDGHKVLVLTSSQNEAERLASDLLGLLGEEKVYLFLGDDNPLAEFVFASQERILLVWKLWTFF